MIMTGTFHVSPACPSVLHTLCRTVVYASAFCLPGRRLGCHMSFVPAYARPVIITAGHCTFEQQRHVQWAAHTQTHINTHLLICIFVYL